MFADLLSHFSLQCVVMNLLSQFQQLHKMLMLSHLPGLCSVTTLLPHDNLRKLLLLPASTYHVVRAAMFTAALSSMSKLLRYGMNDAITYTDSWRIVRIINRLTAEWIMCEPPTHSNLQPAANNCCMQGRIRKNLVVTALHNEIHEHRRCMEYIKILFLRYFPSFKVKNACCVLSKSIH